MSVSMTFYSGFSKRENSTKQPSGGTSYYVVFKDSFSIIGGTVKLQANFDTAKNYTAASYGSNFYNIVDVVSVSNGIVEITLSLDVLATYKSEIASYTSMIERSPSNKNIVNLVDNTISALPQNSRTYKTANVFSLGISFQIKTKNGNGDLAYFLDLAGFNDLLSKFEAAFWTDETKYIVSTKIVTIQASSCGGTSVSSVYIGSQSYNITNGSCYALKSQGYITLKTNTLNMSDIVTTYTDERRYNNNYVTLQCKFNGDIIDLDANYLRYNYFITESNIDPITLDVRLEIKVNVGESDYLIASTHTNIGIGFMFQDVPNAIESVVASMSGLTKSVTEKGIGDLPSGGAAQGPINPNITHKDVAKTLIGGIKTLSPALTGIVSNAIFSAASETYKSGMRVNTAGTPSGSSIAAVMYGEIEFYITEFDSIDKNPNELGYPYMEITNINTVNMTGFYKYVSPQISLSALTDVKNAVNAYLSSGIFYE